MIQTTHSQPKKPTSILLIVFVVALFAVAGLVFSRAVDFGLFLDALTGSLTDANRYTGAVGRTEGSGVVKPVVAKGKLSVTVTTTAAVYAIRNTMTGNVTIEGLKGSSSFELLPGSYAVEFKPVPNYDTPETISTSVDSGATITVKGDYKPWPACKAEDWNCSKFTPCDRKTKTHSRVCLLKNTHCSEPDLVQPALKESCR